LHFYAEADYEAKGRSRPDTPKRVLPAVIAKHSEAVEDVLQKAS
jgi:hypothetical protein